MSDKDAAMRLEVQIPSCSEVSPLEESHNAARLLGFIDPSLLCSRLRNVESRLQKRLSLSLSYRPTLPSKSLLPLLAV